MTAPHHAADVDTPLPKLALAPTSSITGFGGGLSKVTLLELAGPSPASRSPDSAMPSDGGFLTPVSVSVQNHSNDHFEVPDFSMTGSGSSFTSTTRTRRSSGSRTPSRRTGSSVSRVVPVHNVRVVNLAHGGNHDDRGSEAIYPPDDLTDDEPDDDSMVEEYMEPEIVIPAYAPPPVIPKSSLRKIQREDKKKNGQKTKSKKFWKRKLCVIQ